MAPIPVIVVAVGGPTNSGKSTLAQNLLSLLAPPTDPTEAAKSSIASIDIIHQDDFCPPKSEIPWNQAWDVADWDTPYGSSDYRRLERVVRYFREHGCLPDDFQSHEYRRSNYTCTLPSKDIADWRAKFHAVPPLQTLTTTRWGDKAPRVAILLVEGFLLYFDAQLRQQYDVRIYLRISRETMLQRRIARSNYILDDGTVWSDPPGYFEKIVWPSYVEANARMFENHDVEHGAPCLPSEDDSSDGGPIHKMQLIEADHLSARDVCDRACTILYKNIWLDK